jgi:L-lactate dehydrogenase complex protein LldG
MSTDSRSRLLARLRRPPRKSMPSHSSLAQELAALGSAPVTPSSHPDLTTAFMANVLKNNGSIDCASDRSGAVSALARYLYRHYRSQKLAVGNDPRLAALPWRDGGLLPRFEPAENGELAALSYARLGIAETGTVITWTGRANPGRNNLLPDSHIVLVDTEDLVATLEQAFERTRGQMERNGRPRGILMTSGPSSTADIEMQLVEGAHGPQHWHVILLGKTSTSQLHNAYAAAGMALPDAD